MSNDQEKSCVLVFHGGCSDGFCAAWLFWQLYGDRIEYIPFQHGAPVDVNSFTGRHVVVVDFSWKRDVIEAIDKVAESLAVLDHHKTAQKEMEGLPYCTFDMERSGARMAWDWLQTRGFPLMSKGEYSPQNLRSAEWLVNYVQDRDLWDFALPNSRAINAAIRIVPFEFDAWDEARAMGPAKLCERGEVVLQSDRIVIDVHKRHAVDVEVKGHIVPCVNATTLFSDIAGELSEGRPFAMVYFDTPVHRVWSLRSRDGGEDVSEIAKSFGGGGHAQAAGFQTELGHMFPVVKKTG